MIVELCAIVATFVGGAALMRIAGLRGWGLLPLGYIVGTALYITVGLIQLVARFPTTPVWTMLATGLLPLVAWLVLALRGKDVGVPWRGAAISLAALVATTVALRMANLFAWHVDTHDYLGMGAQLADGTFEEFPRESLLTARLLATPLIHAPASLTNDYYLRAAAPLLAVATFAAIVWFFYRGTSHLVDRRLVGILAVAGIAFLATSNRVIHHVFYVNGHLMAGTFVLVIAASAWLIATRRNNVEVRTLVVMMLACLPAVVVTRPEGALLAAVALLPFVLSESVAVWMRSAVLAALGAAMAVWHGYVYLLLASNGYKNEWSTVIMLGAGALFVAMAALLPKIPWLRNGFDVKSRARLLGAAEIAMWLALAALTLREPAVMAKSIDATAKNQVVAGWGVTVLALIAFGVLAAFMLRNHWTSYLRFPFTTFLPLVFLLAYLRGGGYRIGVTDSLNRMWIQVIPIAVLYVITAIALDRETRASSDPAITEPQR